MIEKAPNFWPLACIMEGSGNDYHGRPFADDLPVCDNRSRIHNTTVK